MIVFTQILVDASAKLIEAGNHHTAKTCFKSTNPERQDLADLARLPRWQPSLAKRQSLTVGD